MCGSVCTHSCVCVRLTPDPHHLGCLPPLGVSLHPLLLLPEGQGCQRVFRTLPSPPSSQFPRGQNPTGPESANRLWTGRGNSCVCVRRVGGRVRMEPQKNPRRPASQGVRAPGTPVTPVPGRDGQTGRRRAGRGARTEKNPPAMRRPGFRPCIGKIPWRRQRLPTPAFWPGESYGQRSLLGSSPGGRKESDSTERLKQEHGRQAALVNVIDRANALGSYWNRGLPPP